MIASWQTHLFGSWVKAVLPHCMPINVTIHRLLKKNPTTISVVKKVHVYAGFAKPEWM